MKFFLLLAVGFALGTHAASAQTPQEFAIIAYYSAGPDQVDSIPAEKLTHIIFSFCHLSGNALTVSNGRDSLTIQKLTALKKRNPRLKVILSLGGWGGCMTCSEVFSTPEARKEFSESLLKIECILSDGWAGSGLGIPGH